MKQRYELTYDVRVLERHLREGVITKKDYEEYLKKLPDISDKGCPLVIDEELKEESETQPTANNEGETK